MAGEACSVTCGFCGMCTAAWDDEHIEACEGSSDDCAGEAVTTRDTSDGYLPRVAFCGSCAAAFDQHAEDGPDDPDGEAFRGGEAAAFQRDQMIGAQRLK